MLASKYQDLVRKLILIGSGPFDVRYCSDLKKRRLERLNAEEKEEATILLKEVNQLDDRSFRRLGELMSKADSYDSIPHDSDVVECDSKVFQGVWTEASRMRETGELLKMSKKIICPTVAFHGKFDPHPPEGVKQPLSSHLRNFRFIELDLCGHTPWIERQARERFYDLLAVEI